MYSIKSLDLIVPSLITLKTFPVVDIVDIIEIDPVNKIFLKGCLVPLFPHEYMVLVFLLNTDSSVFNKHLRWLNHFENKIQYNIF